MTRQVNCIWRLRDEESVSTKMRYATCYQITLKIYLARIIAEKGMIMVIFITMMIDEDGDDDDDDEDDHSKNNNISPGN